MFKEIRINHFRGIQDLEISDLGSVNLIVGTNGSGKSTLLDSIFLITNPLNTKLVTSINFFRGYKRIDEYYFSTFFYGLRDQFDIKISARILDESKRDLLIKPKYGLDKFSEFKNEIDFNDISKDLNQDSTQMGGRISGISLVYKNSKFNSSLKSSIEISGSEVKTEQPEDLKEEFRGIYVYANNLSDGSASRLEKVIIEKNLDEVIDVLKIIETSIVNISLGNNNMIYCDVGHSKLLPLNIMGDGFQRLFGILLAMYDAKDGVVFIDEIESGIYYSKFPRIWKAIYKASQRFNVQVFATTHSIECIEQFSQTSLDSELFHTEENLKLFRIEKTTNIHKVTLYDRELLKTSLEKGFEIR